MLFIINGTNAQIVNDTQNRGQLFGSTLALNNVNYVHAQHIEQATNISYLQLIASSIYNYTLDDYETLTEISSATKLMTMFVTVMHLSTVGIDPEIIVHGAKTSVQLIKTAVHNVIDTAFPLIKWIKKLFMIVIVITLIVAISFKIYKILAIHNKQKINAKITKTLNALNCKSETNKEQKVELEAL